MRLAIKHRTVLAANVRCKGSLLNHNWLPTIPLENWTGELFLNKTKKLMKTSEALVILLIIAIFVSGFYIGHSVGKNHVLEPKVDKDHYIESTIELTDSETLIFNGHGTKDEAIYARKISVGDSYNSHVVWLEDSTGHIVQIATH